MEDCFESLEAQKADQSILKYQEHRLTFLYSLKLIQDKSVLPVVQDNHNNRFEIYLKAFKATFQFPFSSNFWYQVDCLKHPIVFKL